MAKSTVISFPVKVAVFVSPYRVTRPSGIEDCGSTRRVSLVSSPSSSRIERKLKLAWKFDHFCTSWKFYSDTISGRISTNFRHARRNKSLIVEHRARYRGAAHVWLTACCFEYILPSGGATRGEVVCSDRFSPINVQNRICNSKIQLSKHSCAALRSLSVVNGAGGSLLSVSLHLAN